MSSSPPPSDHPPLVAGLLDPAAYPFPVERVDLLETHISWLFFAGDRVYKVKKPVRFAFLDYSSLERRRHFCEEEVRLNRRLAPSIYRGAVPVVRETCGAFTVGGSGTATEWAVEMARLPAERMFDHLLEHGEVDNSPLEEVARLLATFHHEVATGPSVDEHATPAAVAELVLGNLGELAPLVAGGSSPELAAVSATVHQFLVRQAETFLAEHLTLLERRVKQGRIRDGHGDLHAGNICFPASGIVAYDCIEFNAGLRCGDVANELAFLCMDLDHRHFHGFGQYLARRYSQITDDPDLLTLLGFYKAHRAAVRAKVAGLTAAGAALGSELRRRQLAQAREYLQLTATYWLPPALVLMCGLPATGKSFAARRLAEAFGAAFLRSDVRRKSLAGLAANTRRQEAFAAGLYSREMTERTYAALLARAKEELGHNRGVVVDATFSSSRQRRLFLRAARRQKVPVFVFHISADEGVVKNRLDARKKKLDEPSDADWDVYVRARDRFEAPDEVLPPHRVDWRSTDSGSDVTGSVPPGSDPVDALLQAMILALSGQPSRHSGSGA